MRLQTLFGGPACQMRALQEDPALNVDIGDRLALAFPLYKNLCFCIAGTAVCTSSGMKYACLTVRRLMGRRRGGGLLLPGAWRAARDVRGHRRGEVRDDAAGAVTRGCVLMLAPAFWTHSACSRRTGLFFFSFLFLGPAAYVVNGWMRLKVLQMRLSAE